MRCRVIARPQVPVREFELDDHVLFDNEILLALVFTPHYTGVLSQQKVRVVVPESIDNRSPDRSVKSQRDIRRQTVHRLERLILGSDKRSGSSR
jgi:hypothetical protein